MKMNTKPVLRAAVLSAALIASGAYAAEMTLFTNPHFRGADVTLRGDINNLERSGFNDRAESVIVRSGRWEVCSDADFAGYCTVLEPGDYSLLNGPLFRRISSAREIAPIAYDDRRRYRYGAYDRSPPVEEHARYGALELYTLPGFRGSTMKLDRSGTSLDKRSTDEGVSSIVIREGVWELCTGLDYSGTCRVFEPGRYPRLGNFEGAPIGSLRRIG